MKTYIYNLLCTTRFWNNLHQVTSKSKDWKAKKLTSLLGAGYRRASNRIKVSIQCIKLSLLTCMVVGCTGTRIPDPPFSSFGPSRDYGMDLYLEVYL